MLDRAGARGRSLAALAAAVEAGVDWLQVRDRALEGRELLELVEEVATAGREAAADRPVRVIVNRRCDVALAAGADGVHLGYDAVDPPTARALLGGERLIGISCHAPEEVRAAGAVSYAQLAPIFPPLSKPSERPPLGVRALRSCASGPPVLAQGGVTPGRIGPLLAAGAAGVAVTGAILQAADPGAAAAALRAALDSPGAPRRDGSRAIPGDPKEAG